jgi:hypothetical protein
MVGDRRLLALLLGDPRDGLSGERRAGQDVRMGISSRLPALLRTVCEWWECLFAKHSYGVMKMVENDKK